MSDEPERSSRPDRRGPPIDTDAETQPSLLAPRGTAPGFGAPLLPASSPFQILRALGQGSFGTVYLAIDRSLNRHVAIKVLHDPVVVSDEVRRQLREEAQLLTRVHHPNVCTVYQWLGADGVDGIVMEYIDGEPLNDALRRGVMDQLRSREVALDVAGALAEIHDHGLCHGDVKPANVVLRRDGRACLVDFGLAKRNAIGDRHSGFAGTRLYAAPELFSGNVRTPSSDVFALGCILYEMLVGQCPAAQAKSADYAAFLRRGIIFPRHLRLDLQAVLRCALSANPESRYRTAAAFEEALLLLRDAPSSRSTNSRTAQPRYPGTLVARKLRAAREHADLMRRSGPLATPNLERARPREKMSCPACATPGRLDCRREYENYHDSEGLYRVETLFAESFGCTACGLVLIGVDQLQEAGLPTYFEPRASDTLLFDSPRAERYRREQQEEDARAREPDWRFEDD